MRQLKLDEAVFLLEPGQQLGTDRIVVAEDLNPRPEDIALGLMAQKQISDADLPGDIKLAKIERGVAKFHVEERGIIHKVAIGTGYQRLAAEPEDDEDYTMGVDHQVYRYAIRFLREGFEVDIERSVYPLCQRVGGDVPRLQHIHGWKGLQYFRQRRTNLGRCGLEKRVRVSRRNLQQGLEPGQYCCNPGPVAIFPGRHGAGEYDGVFARSLETDSPLTGLFDSPHP